MTCPSLFHVFKSISVQSLQHMVNSAPRVIEDKLHLENLACIGMVHLGLGQGSVESLVNAEKGLRQSYV